MPTLSNGICLSNISKNVDRGINTHMVTEIQHVVILAEYRLTDARDVAWCFEKLQCCIIRASWWLVAAAVIPIFPLISVYTMVSTVEQISHIGFSGPLIEAMITHFIMASFIVGALSIGLTLRGLRLYQNALAYGSRRQCIVRY